MRQITLMDRQKHKVFPCGIKIAEIQGKINSVPPTGHRVVDEAEPSLLSLAQNDVGAQGGR